MKRIFLIAGCIIPAMAWAQQGNFVLQVKIAHIGPNAKAHLYYPTGEKSVSDSAVAKNGVFEFKGVLAEPVLAALQVDHEGAGLAHVQGADMLPLYLEKGHTNVIADDSVKLATIPGSKLNREAAEYQMLTAPVQDSMNKHYAAFYAAPEAKQKDKVFNDSLTALYNAQGAKLLAARTHFIQAHPGSFVSMMTLREMAYQEPDILQLEPVFKMLSPGMQNTSYGKEIGGYIAKAKITAVGVMAPLFSQPDANGRQVSLQ
ncbi:MAG TPA: DUF4369 domain-containing protein, partial [Chitinophaga sp.]